MTYFGWGTYIRFFVIGAGIVTLVLFVWPAKAQTIPNRCGSYQSIIAALDLKYNEVIKARARVNARLVLHVFVSLEGTYTLITKTTADYACIVLTGDTWEDVTFEPGQKS